MDWILVGVLAGSIITSGHSTEEACMGRKAMLEKQKITAVCVKIPSNLNFSGTIQLCGNNCMYTQPN